MQTNKIVKYCEDYLKVDEFKDYCHNGLQVEGSEEVGKIIIGVSLSEELIRTAIKKKAQMILVHHGIFMDQIPSPPFIKGYIRNRVKLLLENDINLMGFHLPLDAHPEIGNNASLAKMLDMTNLKPVGIGFVGELKEEMNIEDLIKIINKKLETKSQVVNGGPKKIVNVAVVSGGSSLSFENARVNGADALICGDLRESVVRASEEIGVNIINAGHYNTEKLGVINLGEKIKEIFNIEVEYVDIPCEI